MSNQPQPDTLLGVAGQQQGPQLRHTQIRACDRDTGRSELIDGYTCLTCGWQVALPNDADTEPGLFTVGDYEHTATDCQTRLERRHTSGWFL